MQQLPIIQSLWIGDRLSTMEKLCISSFLYHGHPFHLYTYEHVENIPEGTVIKDANEIVPSEMIFTYKDHDSYAGFSNLFRYKLLFDKGGYWVDTDVVCLQSLTSKAEHVFVSERMEHPTSNNKILITSCIIKAPPGSKIMEYCYNVSVKQKSYKLKWGDTGPKLMDKAVKIFNMESYVATPQEFCPIDWWNWNQFTDRSIGESVLFGTKAVHLWNEMWRRNKIDKDGKFNENSIYEWLKKTYLRGSTLVNPDIKTDNNLVSICVMSYNLEKYIAEALDSILMQKVNFKYNIVIGDDCSSDNTRQILKNYAKKHPNKITLLLHNSNRGMVANFVATLKACHGKYIALLDGDDYWTDPLKLQKQVDFLESNKDYSMIFHNIELHDQTKKGVIIKPFNLDRKSREYTYDEIAKKWLVGTCSVLCINNEQYRYIENNVWFPLQDLSFYLCCASKGKIYYLSEIMSVYRRLLTGSQNSEEFKSLDHSINFATYLKVLYNDFNHIISKDTVRYNLSREYYKVANKFKKNGDKEQYSRYLGLAMEQNSEFIFIKQKAVIEIREKEIVKYKTQIKNREKEIVNYKTELGEQKNKLTAIKKTYSQLINIKAINNPIKKYKSYKKLLRKIHESKS